MSFRGKLAISGCALFVGQAFIIFGLHDGTHKPLLSDIAQLVLGLLVISAALQTASKSDALARAFWRATAWAYSLWCIGQALGVYSDLRVVSNFTLWCSNLLFCFWFMPFVLILLLPPNGEKNAFNRLLIVDFFQAVLFFLAAYIYFIYLPHGESDIWLAPSVRGPYFVVYGLVVTAFLLRSAFSNSSGIRRLFGRMGLFLLLSGLIDASFYYGIVTAPQSGTSFDLIWSLLLIVPMILAATWNPKEQTSPQQPVRPRSLALMQLFPLFYPLAVLTISAGMLRQRIVWAATFVLLSFLCSTTRLLITHHQLLESQEALRQQASHDGLTGLYNRTTIIEILERELVRARRDAKPLCVIMADVDHFKAVNDSAGHNVGDAVLRFIAGQIATGLRPYDSVGRYGGEEFLIVAPGCGPLEAWELGERLRAAISNSALSWEGGSLSVTVSMGIGVTNPSSDLESLLHTADKALYRAKNAGRNRIEPNPEPPKFIPTSPENTSVGVGCLILS